MFLKKYWRALLLAVATLVIASSLMACGVPSSAAIYRKPPPGAVKFGSGNVPVDPDDYAVPSDHYPVYRATQKFLPPAPPDCTVNWKNSNNGCSSMPRTKILTTDVWKVTHVFGGRYLVESSSYSQREERLLEKSGYLSNQYDFAIYILPNGVVAGGWQILPGSSKVFSARYTYLSYAPVKNKGWPPGQVFEQVAAGRADSE